MAEILIARKVCDRHEKRHGKHVDGETHTIVIDGKKFEVDWCDEDRKALTEKLLTELEEYGRAVNGSKPTKQIAGAVPTVPSANGTAKKNKKVATGKRTKAPTNPNAERRYQCLWCDWKPFTSAVGMMLHAASKHGLESTSTSEIFGNKCPLCGAEDVAPLGQHLRTAVHDGESITEAVKLAQKDGDRYGVVAEILAKGHA